MTSTEEMPQLTQAKKQKLCCAETSDNSQDDGYAEQAEYEGGAPEARAKTLNEFADEHGTLFFLAFFVVGIFNNNGYTLVQAAADDLANQFDQSSFMGVFLFVMIFFGAISRFVHGRFFVRVRHTVRILIVTVFTLCSFIMIAIACMNETVPAMFWVAVAASIFTGVSQSFGEAVFLGFLKGFPSYMIGYTSAGTGAAGIFATGTLLFARAVGISNQALFFVEAPTIVLYYFAFKWLDVKRRKYRFVEHGEDLRDIAEEDIVQEKTPPPQHSRVAHQEPTTTGGGETVTGYTGNTDEKPLIQTQSMPSSQLGNPQDAAPADADQEDKENVRLSFAAIRSLLPRTIHLVINLFSVYFLEYAIITAFAKGMQDQVRKKYPEDYKNGVLAVKSLNDIIQFSYQFGVFISRSSLKFVKIKKVWILTLLQAINFVILFINAKILFCDSVYIISPLVVWVGLMGGGSYVNVLHGIRELDTLDQREKESAMSLSLLFNDSGILLAAALSLVLSNTYLKVDVDSS